MALAEADMGMTNMAMDTGVSQARYRGDEFMLVKFYLQPKLDKAETSLQGRPIYEDKEYVSIMVPGGRDCVVRPARQTDIDRWPRHYAAYQNKDENFVVGTPLEMWPAISRAQCEELKHFNIKTVEQLAELADSHAQNFMAIGTLKNRAKLFLEAAKDSAVTEHLQTELEQRDGEIDMLKLAIAEQGAQIQALTERANDTVSDSERHTESDGG